MDYETKILLNRLVEAVGNPDWYTIIITSVITIINASIMLWLGWKQYKLQQKQVKLEEYDLYRQMYNCINAIHINTTGFTLLVYWGFAEINSEHWNERKKEIALWMKSIDDLSVDFQLKFPEEIDLLYKYKVLISLMSMLITQAEAITKEGLLNKQCNQINKTVNDIKKTEKELLSMIASRIVDGENKNEFINTINDFLLFRKSVFESNILDKIKKRI